MNAPQVTSSPTTVPNTTDTDLSPVGVKIIHASEADFDEVIKSGKVVVDFWAEWCGPCHAIAPMIEELSKKYDGQIKFVKVDTDANSNLAQKYGVFSIPNLFFFENGVAKGNQPGAYPLPVLEQNIKNAFGMN